MAGDARTLFVADAGNHRVLAWSGVADGDRDADAVIGQPDFASNAELPYRPQTARTLRFSYAIASDDRVLLAADTVNNRVLVFTRGVSGHASADGVLAIGQPDLSANGENRWTRVTRETLCWPNGLGLHEDTLAVADSGNNRVMPWRLAGAGATAEPERSVPSCV